MRVICISFYSLAFRTRLDVVEQIVRKYLLLWWSVCVFEVTFYSLIYFNIKISSNALTKLRWKKLRKLRTAIIKRPMRLQLIICHKKELLPLLSSIKLKLIHNKCYQCKLICTGAMNKCCKILTIKILTEDNKT